MPITAYVSTDNTPGSAGVGGNYYKELTFTVAVGDRIFAWGTSADANTSGPGDVQTTAGPGAIDATGWVLMAESHVSGTAGFTSAYGTVGTAGSITVRVDVQCLSGTVNMVAGAWVVPAGEWTGTPTYVALAGTPATGLATLNVPSTSNVMYAMGDWNAATVGTSTSPAGGTVDERFDDNTTYAVFAAHWASQASGSTDYGSSGGSGQAPRGMAVAQPTSGGGGPSLTYDTATVGTAYTATGSQTTSHAGSASARGAVVLIDQNGTTADEVSGVTYGGTAMTRLRFDTEATEAGATYIYWLDNVPTGTQNVVMTTTAATNKQLVVATLIATSGYGVTVAGHNSGTSASVANPSWTITGLTAASDIEAFEVIHSGLTTMTTTPAAGWTLISSTDLGAQGRGFARQTVASSGTSLTCGWAAATADDFVGSSVAFTLVALGTNYSKTPADAEGITDSIVNVQALVRGPADPVGITDSAVDVQSNVRTQNDPVGITDNVTASLSGTLTQTLNDPVGITDVASDALDGVRGPSDPTGITDALTVVQTTVQSVADPVGITDSVATTTENDTGWTEPVGITDSVTASLSSGAINYTQTPNDPVGITDSVALVQDIQRAQTDTVGITDTASAVQAIVETSTDSVGITDSVTSVLNIVQTLSDSVGITDAASANLVASGSQSFNDPVGVSDAVGAAQDLVRTQSDSVGLTDALTLDRSQSVTDSEGITDSVTAVQAIVETQADSVGITDNVTASLVGSSTQNIPDNVGITDTVVTVQAMLESITDAEGITDSISVTAADVRSTSDAVGITDTVIAQLDRVVTVNDFLNLVDGVSTDYVTVAGSNIPDPVGVTDTVSKVSDANRILSDPVGLSDSVTAVMTRIITINDFLAITDTYSVTGAPIHITVTGRIGQARWRGTIEDSRWIGEIMDARWKGEI